MKSLLSVIAVMSLFSGPAMAAGNPQYVTLKAYVVQDHENGGFKMFVVQMAKPIAWSEGLPKDAVERFVTSGFEATLPPKSLVQVKECREAILTITAEKGNVLPNDNGQEIFRIPEIVSFGCQQEK